MNNSIVSYHITSYHSTSNHIAVNTVRGTQAAPEGAGLRRPRGRRQRDEGKQHAPLGIPPPPVTLVVSPRKAKQKGTL